MQNLLQGYGATEPPYTAPDCVKSNGKRCAGKR